MDCRFSGGGGCGAAGGVAALHVVEFAFLGGFDSLPLRHAVRTAEKYRRTFPQIREIYEFLGINALTNRTAAWQYSANFFRIENLGFFFAMSLSRELSE